MEGLTAAEAAVLLAVHRGFDTVESIARLLNTSRETVESIIEKLKSRGLVEEYTTGFIIKRRRIRLTEHGLNAVPEAMRLLEHAAEAARRIASQLSEVHSSEAVLQPASRTGYLAPGLALMDLLFVLPMLQTLGLIGLGEAVLLSQLLSSEEQDHEEHVGVEGYEDYEGGEYGDYEGGDTGVDVDAGFDADYDGFIA
ncbi:MarR family transcriptional regulator [Hyperthermus butylicus]|uniref:HTH marR-type domain-containing protein n=1 Tax=Hyperthermus butylicus (strain DSM 5456 / JCM 9403 / PLM1-5) TaxID=415426 RepID=A2BMY7_HYPBU|nr:MarR family transcriptional regulator [Hyperthermus butylicus]ABM81348.1 hypothetical protein Hbut_1526 [Hyperthermus butylicus DSM 5456]